MTFEAARVRAVLFDLDGTLADTDDEYIRRGQRWLNPVRFLFPQGDPYPFLRWGVMAIESPANWVLGVPDWLGLDDEIARGLAWLAERRGPPWPGHFALMAGADGLLARLSERYPLAVVTARGLRPARAFLDQFNLARHFGALAHAQAAPHTKPFPDPVLWAADQLKVPAEACLMVGDTPVDMLAGKRAGAQAVGVLRGFGRRAELLRAGADMILETTADLADVLLGA